MTWMGTEWDDTAGDLGMFNNTLIQRTMMGESQFFRFEQFYLPATIKELFRFCAYTYLTNDAINPAIEKLSEYPITEFMFDPIVQAKAGTPEHQQERESREPIVDAWTNLFDVHLRAKSFAIKLGSNYYNYGNAFVSVYQPFDRILICGNSQCREHHLIKKVKWEWDKGKLNFVIKCPKCGFKGAAKVQDKLVKDPTRINLISWYPGNIDIDYDPYSGCKEYYYNIPDDEVKKIREGNKLRLENTPWDIIEAVKMHKGARQGHPKIKFHSDNIFHLRRDSIDIPGAESPWGMPIIVAALRSVLYLNMMKRAQTALMMEHILPFRYLYPANDNGANSSIPIDLGDWRRRMKVEIRRWKRDPLYIMLTPIPVAQEQMGGQGKALMLFPEMAQVREEIINALNIPIEFIKGGLQYSGTSVSLRMLENQLMNQTEQVVKCFKWIVSRVSKISGMDRVEVKLRKFKMADDIQQKQLLTQLWAQGVISGELLGNVMEFDAAEEARKRGKENIDKAVADARAQAEAANRMMSLQSLLQQTLAPEMAVTMPQIDPGMVEQVYQGIGKLKPEQQEMYIQQIGAQNPQLARELQTRASTDINNYGQTMQTMLAMSPQQQAGFMQQMQQQNPVQALIMANLLNAFPGLEQAMPQGGGSPAGGPPGQGGVEKSMPEQKPPTRKGGSPM